MANIFGNASDNTLTGSDGNDYIDAGAGNDTILAKAGDDTVYAGDGDDTIDGGSGDDELWGDAGNDLLLGGPGNDYMVGGGGNDTYFIEQAGDVTVEGGGGGIDVVRVSVDFYTLGYNVENGSVRGSAGLHITGNKLNNWIVGGSGADTLSGVAGNDSLNGKAGNDALIGGDGGDILTGGTGQDRLSGGGGNDRFVFRDGDFAGLTAATCDRITDFSHAEGDRIRLDQVDADSMAAGRQGFTFIGSAGFHHVAGELRYHETGGNTYVTGDTNGDAMADFMIRLDGGHALLAGDFVL